ncbi:hypothetical protein VKT23_009440 [Stygiomarasmius scandens]|uniref:Uncharacterized protein n=1 Tax=Marasmiellus scandens TaxID=2682957 RepID=A0ABR1JHW3_9AGAR
MAQAGLKRSEAVLGEAADIDMFPKVQLITQPEFGHELRRARHMIAELKGQVAYLEWSRRTDRKYATNLEKELVELRNERDELEGEVKQLQVYYYFHWSQKQAIE